MAKEAYDNASIKYKSVDIWYFSGTGNAKFAAEHIAKNASEKNIPNRVFNVAQDPIKPEALDQDKLIGFCFPTHGFNAPPIILKFLWNFPKGQSDVFLLNTRAGLKMSKLHLPGIGGLALWLTALILALKGYHVRGFRPLDMPSNWISLHPGVRKKVVQSIHSNCKQTLNRFSNRIFKGKWVLNGLIWIPIDILVSPISVAYYFYGRFALAKTYFANTACNNCNLCIDDCPVKAIIEKDGRPFWTINCESCMHCMNACPHRAIETAHSIVIPLWWLAFSLIPHWTVKGLVNFGYISQEFYLQYYDYIFYGVMLSLGSLLVLYGYRLLHWLLGFKSINKIITYTSLTHYSWWRRYLARKFKTKSAA